MSADIQCRANSQLCTSRMQIQLIKTLTSNQSYGGSKFFIIHILVNDDLKADALNVGYEASRLNSSCRKKQHPTNLLNNWKF